MPNMDTLFTELRMYCMFLLIVLAQNLGFIISARKEILLAKIENFVTKIFENCILFAKIVL